MITVQAIVPANHTFKRNLYINSNIYFFIKVYILTCFKQFHAFFPPSEHLEHRHVCFFRAVEKGIFEGG